MVKQFENSVSVISSKMGQINELKKLKYEPDSNHSDEQRRERKRHRDHESKNSKKSSSISDSSYKRLKRRSKSNEKRHKRVRLEEKEDEIVVLKSPPTSKTADTSCIDEVNERPISLKVIKPAGLKPKDITFDVKESEIETKESGKLKIWEISDCRTQIPRLLRSLAKLNSA